ncbi:DNA-binding MarR family transcriptional regulator [Labrenzia sp. EL_208]|nr:DNA-binding MarR family transcriptional regulator [Labrenzia sp. EL_132]MBG6230842.1 DNA-binding MarR family transcriptional regulator [Labrenzia sp. EL_208]
MNTELYINNLLGAFATTLASAIDESVDEVGLRSGSAATALVTIFNHPDESIDVLRRILNLTHSGAVRLINSLESEGLVERAPSLKDRRAVVLRVTSGGEARAKAVLAAREDMTNRIVEDLTVEQRDALLPVLATMLNTLTDDQDSARRNCRLCNEGVCRPRGCPVEQAAK